MRTLASLLVVGALGAAAPAAETKLVILPGDFTLAGPGARQRLVVERMHGERYVGEAAEARFASSDEKVARLEGAEVVPVADGAAIVTATVGDRRATVNVRVVDMSKPFQWSFRNHVESVMLKSGCTTGPCHGAQAGKGGFKLSLRGYDPEGDYWAITRQARGRRITPTEPGRSLMLTKPTGAVAHKGGLRFRVDSLEYRVLSQWIAAGAPPPTPNDARIARIEIVPHNVVLKKGDSQPLLVRAHFDDGRI